MGWLDDIVAGLQQGGAPGAITASPFPDVVQPPKEDPAALWAAIDKQNADANAAADRRNVAGLARPPIVGGPQYGDNPLDMAGVNLAMNPMGQANTSSPFGSIPAVPPSLQLASQAMQPPSAPIAPGAPAPNLPPPQAIPPLPQPRPASAPQGDTTPDDVDTDISSRNRTPAPMAVGAAPTMAQDGTVNPVTLPSRLGFGQALMGIGAALGGDGGATTIALQKAQDAKDLNVQQQNLTIRALRNKGVPESDIAGAIGNPEILKALVTDNFGRSKYKIQQVGEDEFGNKQYAAVNENDPTDSRPFVNGRIVTDKTIPSGDAVSPSGGFLNKGVTSVDHSLVGEEYLQQYSPQVQDEVRNYVNGLTMPTANPRHGYTQQIKNIAAKYGSDIGMPADDTTFGARRTMRNDLAKSSPGSIGGQISIGNTALGHLADLSQKATELGNYDVGLAGPSHLINDVRGWSSAQSAKMEALKGAAQHYGQEVTKFYSGSPGGEAERNRFLQTVNAAKTPQELAAVIETEASLMKDRISSLQSNIQTTLGDEGVKKYPVIRDVGQKSLDTITSNVGKLRGGNSTPASLPTVNSPSDAARLPRGTHFLDPNGVERVVP